MKALNKITYSAAALLKFTGSPQTEMYWKYYGECERIQDSSVRTQYNLTR